MKIMRSHAARKKLVWVGDEKQVISLQWPNMRSKSLHTIFQNNSGKWHFKISYAIGSLVTDNEDRSTVTTPSFQLHCCISSCNVLQITYMVVGIFLCYQVFQQYLGPTAAISSLSRKHRRTNKNINNFLSLKVYTWLSLSDW